MRLVNAKIVISKLINMSEEKIQSDCCVWFWNSFPGERRMLFHADNNSVNQIVGAKKKALGVVRGVSDLILVFNDKVIFIELKTSTGTLSEEQKDFSKKVKDRGHCYIVVRSFEQFKSIINQLYGTNH